VFGNERPKPKLNKGAGLDVSPAVRDYLELNETDVTDWRFIEISEVSRGPWSALGENNTFVISDRKTVQGIGHAAPKRAEVRPSSPSDSPFIFTGSRWHRITNRSMCVVTRGSLRLPAFFIFSSFWPTKFRGSIRSGTQFTP